MASLHCTNLKRLAREAGDRAEIPRVKDRKFAPELRTPSSRLPNAASLTSLPVPQAQALALSCSKFCPPSHWDSSGVTGRSSHPPESAFLLGQINNCVVIYISAAPGGSAVGAGISVYEATDAVTVVTQS
jgi:hypothetical protein